MKGLGPRGMILLGFCLVLLGVILPWLMVMRILQPSFLLGLVTYLASLAGLILGLVGSALYVRERRS